MRKLSIFIVLGMLICIQVQAIDRDGLVGEWTFDDGTGTDTTGNGNDSSGDATNVEGISGRAMEFDGSQGMAIDAFSDDFVFDQGFSLEVWVNPQAGSQTMVRKGGAANFLIELGVGRTNDPGTTPQFGFATDQVGIGASIVTGDDPLPLDRWSMVSMTYDGSVLRGYVNGELIAENPVTGSALNDTSQPLLFGNFGSEIFIGVLDEIRIWNKPLSQEQILNDFEEFAPNLNTNIVGEWLFEGDTNDSSGEGNDATNNGGTFVPGLNGEAIHFEGTHAVVESFSDGFVFEDEFSLSLWVKPQGGSQTMIRKGGSANFLLELGVGRTNDPGTTPQFGFATDEVNIGASIVTGNTSLPQEQWAHLAMIYDGQNLKGYINGIEIASNPVTGLGINDPSQFLFFGTWASEVFFGELDEIRIWNRALRVREIEQLFLEHGAKPDVFQLQVGERDFNDLSFTAGSPLEVRIKLEGQAGDVTVTETPPAGWDVSNISNGGTLSGGDITWNVSKPAGLFTLSYTVTPPGDASGNVEFSGQTGSDPTGGFTTLVPSEPIGIFENHLDVGEVLPDGGSAEFSDGTYTIVASGREIWNHMDNFHFVYNRTDQDFVLTSFVETFPLESAQEWLKAGLVVRDTLAPSSSYALVYVRNDLQVGFQFRPRSRIYPNRTATLFGFDVQDGVIQIERKGSLVTVRHRDLNTGEFVDIDSMEIELENPAYVGLAVSAALPSAGDGLGAVEGTFSDVEFETSEPAGLLDWSIY